MNNSSGELIQIYLISHVEEETVQLLASIEDLH
jgi:hypothetical protein